MHNCPNTQHSLLEAQMFDNRTNLFFFKLLLIFMLSAVLLSVRLKHKGSFNKYFLSVGNSFNH